MSPLIVIRDKKVKRDNHSFVFVSPYSFWLVQRMYVELSGSWPAVPAALRRYQEFHETFTAQSLTKWHLQKIVKQMIIKTRQDKMHLYKKLNYEFSHKIYTLNSQILFGFSSFPKFPHTVGTSAEKLLLTSKWFD